MIFQPNAHCVKSIRIRSFSGPYSVAFELNMKIRRDNPYSTRMQGNTDQKNSKYGYFSRIGSLSKCYVKDSLHCNGIMPALKSY